MAKTVCQACRGYDLERQWCDRCKGAGYEEAAQPAESSDSRDDDAEFRAWREQQWSAGINPTERDAWMERARRERDLLASVATPAVDYTAQQQAEPVGDERAALELWRKYACQGEKLESTPYHAARAAMGTNTEVQDKGLYLAIQAYLRAAQSGQRAGVAEGWKLVPLEPTFEMQEAGYCAWDSSCAHRERYVYRAMIAAAPTPAAQGDQS